MTNPDAVRGIDDLRRALGEHRNLSWEPRESSEADAGHLSRLLALPPGQAGAPDDLYSYAHDLCYTDIDSRLLVRLLPTCLQAWYGELRGTRSDYGGFVEYFYSALAHRHIFDTHLAPRQATAVAHFMASSILEEMDAQRDLPYRDMNARRYRWIRALTTYGVLLPDIEHLWARWWSSDTIGCALCLVQYVSVLVYDDDSNPIFAPWTRNDGGGPPCLWEFEGLLDSPRWLASNVTFLGRRLTPSAVADALQHTVVLLTNSPEYEVAAQLESDLRTRAGVFERRCTELPSLLATRQAPGTLLTWSL